MGTNLKAVARPGIRSSCSSAQSHPSYQVALHVRAGSCIAPASLIASFSHFPYHNNRDCLQTTLERQQPPSRWRSTDPAGMLTWESMSITNIHLSCMQIGTSCAMLTKRLGKSRSLPSTFAKRPASRRSRPNVGPQPPRHSDEAHCDDRQTCTSMYRIHMGPQELCVVLAGHESVGHARSHGGAMSALEGRNPTDNRSGSQFSPMRSRRSKRSLPYTRSSKKAIPSFSRRRNPTPAGWRVYREAPQMTPVPGDMHRLFQSTSTT